MVTLVTAWCSKGAQGSPPERCPACSSPSYTDRVFVDLKNVGGFCKPFPIVSQESFLPRPCWLWHCPFSWSRFLSPFSSVPSFLIVALHFPLAAGLQRGVSQLATATYQGTTILLRRETLVLLDPGQGWVPTLPRAESLVALGTAAWPQEQGYCMTSAGGALSPPPDCTS